MKPYDESAMLATAALVGFIATEDREKAKFFYGNTLGLKMISEDGFACVFEAGGNMLRVAMVQKRVPAPYTVLGWETADIGKLASEMAASGIEFENFPGLGQNPSGIWTAPDGSKVAWFKDPDGNLLSISQHPAHA